MALFRTVSSRGIVLVLLATLPGFFMLIFQATEQRNNIHQQAFERAALISQQVIYAQQQLIQQSYAYLHKLSKQPALQQPNEYECSQFIQNALSLNSMYSNIGVPLPDGTLLCNAHPLSHAVNVADRPYFQRALHTKNFSIGELQQDRAAQVMSMNFAYPVFKDDNSGDIVGVVVAVLSLAWWSDYLAKIQLPPDAIAIISDSSGTVAANYPASLPFVGQSLKHIGLGDLPMTTAGVNHDGIERIFKHAELFSISSTRQVMLTIGIPVAIGLDKANQQFILKLMGLSIALILILLLARWGMQISVLKPLRALLKSTQSLEKGGALFTASEPMGTVEFNELQQRFQRMANTRLKAESTAKASAHAFESILNAMPDLYFKMQPDSTILDYHAPNPKDLFLSPNQFLGHKMLDLLPKYAAELWAEKLRIFNQTQQLQCWEYSLNIQGHDQCFEARLTHIVGENVLILVIRNITERKNAEAQILYQANYDALTHLPNRNLFLKQLEQQIKTYKHTKRTFAVLYLDLDQFKEVNDALGHEVGDLLLVSVAQRILTCVRDSDTVARMGGDEFTIILNEFDSLYDVENIAQQIINTLSQAFHLHHDNVYISASIGITLYPKDAQTVTELLKQADQAMYLSKKLGRNQFKYFTESLQQEAMARRSLIKELREAIQEEQFEVVFQPIIDLRTGEVRKAEALIRWNHPEKGLIGPEYFIRVAEESGLIVEMSDWVFQQVLNYQKRWINQFEHPLQISINRSPVQFHTQPLQNNWAAQIKRYQLPENIIVVEITEGLLLGTDKIILSQLHEFHDMGVQIAIDDFGTGYSSLSYLKRFDIDYLKIDQSFVRNLSPDSDDQALCEAMIVMAHKLGLKVIAEGIETPMSLKILKQAGCDYGQGYHFSRPLNIARFEQFIAAKNSAIQI